jgi:hypothetical protein
MEKVKNVLSVDNPLPIPVRSSVVTENICYHKLKITEKVVTNMVRVEKSRFFQGRTVDF